MTLVLLLSETMFVFILIFPAKIPASTAVCARTRLVTTTAPASSRASKARTARSTSTSVSRRSAPTGPPVWTRSTSITVTACQVRTLLGNICKECDKYVYIYLCLPAANNVPVRQDTRVLTARRRSTSARRPPASVPQTAPTCSTIIIASVSEVSGGGITRILFYSPLHTICCRFRR